jgi:hypothetical protein
VQVDHTPLAGEEPAPLASPSSPLMGTYLADYLIIAVLGTILAYLWMQ